MSGHPSRPPKERGGGGGGLSHGAPHRVRRIWGTSRSPSTAPAASKATRRGPHAHWGPTRRVCAKPQRRSAMPIAAAHFPGGGRAHHQPAVMEKGQVAYCNGHMPRVQRGCERHCSLAHDHEPALRDRSRARHHPRFGVASMRLKRSAKTYLRRTKSSLRNPRHRVSVAMRDSQRHDGAAGIERASAMASPASFDAMGRAAESASRTNRSPCAKPFLAGGATLAGAAS